MKRTKLIAILVIFASGLFGQNHYLKQKAMEDKPPSDKDISSSTIVSTNYYEAGTTMNLTFTLNLNAPDLEFGDSVSLVFPTGITPTGNASDPIAIATQGQGDETLNGVSGQVISWGDNDNSYGGIEVGSHDFFVEVTIDGNISGPQTVDFFISGDQYANPADASGTITIKQYVPKQEVYASSGNYSENSNLSLSWTLGESIIETYENPYVIITQGFQQSRYIITNITEQTPVINISVYPNPTSDFLNIEVKDNTSESLLIELVDITGKSLLTKNIDNNHSVLDMNQYHAGNYFLKIRNKRNNINQVYKIIKNY
ncbi:MAG: hypothetical protein Kow0068_23880 [Marinilabiliales bacterium]